ncbi:MAG: hypothetical protein J6P03_02580, partial [Opitutales bacterium]|nr:hypothetical protein [Opitutales bacterium]
MTKAASDKKRQEAFNKIQPDYFFGLFYARNIFLPSPSVFQRFGKRRLRLPADLAVRIGWIRPI